MNYLSCECVACYKVFFFFFFVIKLKSSDKLEIQDYYTHSFNDKVVLSKRVRHSKPVACDWIRNCFVNKRIVAQQRHIIEGATIQKEVLWERFIAGVEHWVAPWLEVAAT